MEEHSMNFAELPPELIEEHEEYEVEQVLASRLFGWWKKLQYLICWKGYSQAHDSWVSCDDVHTPDVTIHRTRYHTCLYLALLCICDTRALDAMDRDALMARYGLLFMVVVAFCLYDTRCVDE
jgi:Chromo (CHRromatin Organisation MOdifier) domain